MGFVYLLAFFLMFFGKIYPGVSVADIPVGGLTPEAAIAAVSQSFQKPSTLHLVSASPDQAFEISTQDLNLNYDLSQSVDHAFRLGRSGNPVFNLAQILISLTQGKNLGLTLSLDESALNQSLATIASEFGTEPVNPYAEFKNNQVIIFKGEKGTQVNALALRAQVAQSLAFANPDPITIPSLNIDPTLNPFEAEAFRARAEVLSKKTLTLTQGYQSFTFKGNDLLSFLDPKGGYANEPLIQEIGKVAAKINRPPQNPIFKFAAGRVAEFAPAQDGLKVNADQTKDEIIKLLTQLETSDPVSGTSETTLLLEIPVTRTAPKIQTAQVNDLGIKELVGRGTSRFRGSIPSRVYNINLAATRINGTLVPPGEVFSFNATVGDVSKLTGYREAYVIKDGKTVLGDGGGLCQVSTTLFRAALNAGLPIVERRAHSYRVGYYEQDSGPGLDATVFAPTTDFKFKNDTPTHILIQAYPDTKNLSLVFELYGTSDGRVSHVDKPVVSSSTTPPPDLYVDDPTLPAGTVKQIEHRAFGAKTSFTYKVTRNENVLQNTVFYSSYRPWQAVYLRGTGPAQ